MPNALPLGSLLMSLKGVTWAAVRAREHEENALIQAYVPGAASSVLKFVHRSTFAPARRWSKLGPAHLAGAARPAGWHAAGLSGPCYVRLRTPCRAN